MEKEIRKKIEYAFYNYEILRNKSAQELVDLAYKNIAVRYDKISVKGSSGKTMQDRICEISDKASEDYRWTLVVEKTIEHYRFDKDISSLIQLHYFQKKGEVEACLCIGISRATLFRFIDKIINIAEQCAISLGVIS